MSQQELDACMRDTYFGGVGIVHVSEEELGECHQGWWETVTWDGSAEEGWWETVTWDGSAEEGWWETVTWDGTARLRRDGGRQSPGTGRLG